MGCFFLPISEVTTPDHQLRSSFSRKHKRPRALTTKHTPEFEDGHAIRRKGKT